MAHWVAIDFDGTLSQYHGAAHGHAGAIGPPHRGMLALVKALLARDCKVAIFSARAGNADGVRQIREWLRDHHFPAGLEITAQKEPEFSVFLDDRGAPAGDLRAPFPQDPDEGLMTDTAHEMMPTDVTIRQHEGVWLVAGMTPAVEQIRGVVVVAASAPEDLSVSGRPGLLWSVRGDTTEMCRALAHFLLLNPPVCDIVLGMVAIGRSGRLDGGQGSDEAKPTGGET